MYHLGSGTQIEGENRHKIGTELMLKSKFPQEAEAIRRRQKATEAALQEASVALESKEGMIRWIDTGVTFLQLLVGVGSSASSVCHPAVLVFYVSQGHGSYL